MQFAHRQDNNNLHFVTCHHSETCDCLARRVKKISFTFSVISYLKMNIWPPTVLRIQCVDIL